MHFDSLMKDLRFGARMLLKQPGFSLIATLTLALGIGATTAVFSLIEGVLLTPPPYRQPDRLVLIPAVRMDGKEARAESWSAAQWIEWQHKAVSMEAIAAYGWTFNFIVQPNGSDSMEGMFVTPDYFRALGVQPVLGRAFLDSEVGKPLIVLGYDFWQKEFHGDPHIIGKTIHMSRQDAPPVVIGVMPPHVRFLPSPGASQEPNYNLNAAVDFWLPGGPDPKHMKDRYWDVVGRLKSGVTVQRAQAELTALAAREAEADRDFAGFKPRMLPLSDELNRDGRGILLPLLGAAGLVLLIACGNVAALLLVRGLQRQQEYAIRQALGVSRAGLLRQVSAEGLLMALGGGTLGALLAFGIVRIFQKIGGHAIPRLDSVTAGWPILAWGLAAALIAALLAGMIPALRAARLDPNAVLKAAGPKSSTGRGERRLLRAVTMAQSALTLALLVGSGLLIRTMINVAHVRAGYRTDRILKATVTATQGNWLAFHRQALERVSAIPGVEYAAFAWGVPLTGNDWPGEVEIEGMPPAAKASDRLQLPLRAVTPGYFDLFSQAITAGRDFRPTDTRDAPGVAIINQALVERYLPHTNPLGKKLWPWGGRRDQGLEIVGGVANSRTGDLTKPAEPEVYFPLWQAQAFSKDLVVRTAADPMLMMPAVERALRSVDPTAAVENVKTMEQIREDSLASRSFAERLLIGFAALGSVLTLVGIYGVLALSVASRRREIAIRAAVGARRRDIRNLILAEGCRLIAGGVIAGAVAALLLARVLRSFLFGVNATDPGTFVFVGLLFALVALLACWAPMRRALTVDPTEALRYE